MATSSMSCSTPWTRNGESRERRRLPHDTSAGAWRPTGGDAPNRSPDDGAGARAAPPALSDAGATGRAVPLTPTGWCEQLDQTPIDLLFVESAWHGNDDTWRFQVIGPQGPSGHLREMVTALRKQGVPTVFWNKEDPAH